MMYCACKSLIWLLTLQMSTVKWFIKVKCMKSHMLFLQRLHMKWSSMTLIGQHHEEYEAWPDILLVLLVLLHHHKIVWSSPHQIRSKNIVINILFKVVAISRVAAQSQQNCVRVALIKMKTTNTTFASGGLVYIVGLITYNWRMG